MMSVYNNRKPTDSQSLLDVFLTVKGEYSSPLLIDSLLAVDALEQLIEDDGWDMDSLKVPDQILQDSYFEQQNQSECAKRVFDRIVKVINSNQGGLNPLAPTKYSKKYHHFTKCTDFRVPGSINSSRSEFATTVDRYISDEYRFLKRFETVALQSNLPISEHLVTGYHQSGLSIPQYIAENELFIQLAEQSAVSPHSKNIHLAREAMNNYLIQYERSIAKPLPHNADTPLSIHQFSDSSSIIVNYMIEINNAIHRFLSTNHASYPIQLDTFFVAPDTHQDLDLHSLDGLQHCTKVDPNSIDGVSSVYRLLRKAAMDINGAFSQRFVMLIVRGNKEDSNDDTVYIFKPTANNSIPALSDNVELTWLLNSKAPIVPGLASNDEGVLGFTHHLHSSKCTKVYLSYGEHKSRVFKHDLLNKLQILLDCHKEAIDHDKMGATQWYAHTDDEMMAPAPSSMVDRCSIPENTQTSFKNHYRAFRDDLYRQFGEYFFNNEKAYECYAPYWNPKNCRAMGNVFIPKDATKDLKPYIVESFDSVQKLFYKLDYTVAMQIVDQQTLFIQFPQSQKPSICVIPTELHRKESGELLYAIIVPNNLAKNQRWKIIDYTRISDAFMTKDELMDAYGVFERDLPKGSKAKHNDFAAPLGNIHVTKKSIERTTFHNVHIVQSNQNKYKMRMDPSEDVCRISERRFKELVLESFLKPTEFTPMAHIEYRNHRYHLEKLLPVFIPEYDQYVAVSFSFNEKRKTYATGVCFDVTDMKNKANLIQAVPSDSWLNYKSAQPRMVKLTITKQNIPMSKPKYSPSPPAPIKPYTHSPALMPEPMPQAPIKSQPPKPYTQVPPYTQPQVYSQSQVYTQPQVYMPPQAYAPQPLHVLQWQIQQSMRLPQPLYLPQQQYSIPNMMQNQLNYHNNYTNIPQPVYQHHA